MAAPIKVYDDISELKKKMFLTYKKERIVDIQDVETFLIANMFRDRSEKPKTNNFFILT